MKKTYYVYGWYNGADHDTGKNPDCMAVVNAVSEMQAEESACERFSQKHGKCDVILAQEKE